MNIQEFRQQYPEYDDLDDRTLVDGLHSKFYSDIPVQDFYSQVGFSLPAPQDPAIPQPPPGNRAFRMDPEKFPEDIRPVKGAIWGEDHDKNWRGHVDTMAVDLNQATDDFLGSKAAVEDKAQELDTLQKQIEAARTNPNTDPAAFKKMADGFNRQVKDYNSMVKDLNSLATYQNRLNDDYRDFFRYRTQQANDQSGLDQEPPGIGAQLISLPKIAWRGIGKGTGDMAAGTRAFIETSTSETDEAFRQRFNSNPQAPLDQMSEEERKRYLFANPNGRTGAPPPRSAFQSPQLQEERRRFLEGEGKTNAIGALKTFESAYPEPLEGIKTPGMLQRSAAGVTRSIPGMAMSAANPALGSLGIFGQIMGQGYDEYTKMGVDKDRAFNSAFFNALAQTPAESLGNVFQLGVLKDLVKTFRVSGSATKRLMAYGEALLKSGAGEGVENLIQQFPDEFAKFYAANPGRDPVDITKHALEKWKENAPEAWNTGVVGGMMMTGVTGLSQAPFSIADYRMEKKRGKAPEGGAPSGGGGAVAQMRADLEKGMITREELAQMKEGAPPEVVSQIDEVLKGAPSQGSGDGAPPTGPSGPLRTSQERQAEIDRQFGVGENERKRMRGEAGSLIERQQAEERQQEIDRTWADEERQRAEETEDEVIESASTMMDRDRELAQLRAQTAPRGTPPQRVVDLGAPGMAERELAALRGETPQTAYGPAERAADEEMARLGSGTRPPAEVATEAATALGETTSQGAAPEMKFEGKSYRNLGDIKVTGGEQVGRWQVQGKDGQWVPVRNLERIRRLDEAGNVSRATKVGEQSRGATVSPTPGQGVAQGGRSPAGAPAAQRQGAMSDVSLDVEDKRGKAPEEWRKKRGSGIVDGVTDKGEGQIPAGTPSKAESGAKIPEQIIGPQTRYHGGGYVDVSREGYARVRPGKEPIVTKNAHIFYNDPDLGGFSVWEDGKILGPVYDLPKIKTGFSEQAETIIKTSRGSDSKTPGFLAKITDAELLETRNLRVGGTYNPGRIETWKLSFRDGSTKTFYVSSKGYPEGYYYDFHDTLKGAEEDLGIVSQGQPANRPADRKLIEQPKSESERKIAEYDSRIEQVNNELSVLDDAIDDVKLGSVEYDEIDRKIDSLTSELFSLRNKKNEEIKVIRRSSPNPTRPPGDGGRLSLSSTATPTGLPLRTVESALRPLISRIKGVEIVAVKDVADLPANVLKGQTVSSLSEESRGRIRGVHSVQDGKSTIFLVASNMNSPRDVHLTTLHELVGHEGLRRAMASDKAFQSFLDKLYGSKKNDDLMKWIRENYRFDTETEYGRRKASDEWFARMATENYGKEEIRPWWNRFVQIFREWTRKLGFRLTLSDREVLDTMRRARQAVEREGDRIDKVGKKTDNSLMYAGEKAAQKPSPLEDAKARIAAGEDPKTVRRETGWFKGPYDKKWRFEIDDSKATIEDFWLPSEQDASFHYRVDSGQKSIDSLSPKSRNRFEKIDRVMRGRLKLPEILDHPELFKAYPWLRNIKIKPLHDPHRRGTAFGDIIDLNPAELLGPENKYQLRSTLLHEIQHLVQITENLARGGPNKNLAGEIESRDVSARADLTKEQRDETEPYSSENIPEEEAITRFAGPGESGMMASVTDKGEGRIPATPGKAESGEFSKVLFLDENENAVVWATDKHRLTVDKPGKAGTIVLWTKQDVKGREYWRKSGNLYTTEKTKKIEGETGKYLTVSSIEIDKSERGQGLGTKMYQALMGQVSPEISGILSYTPTRVNKKEVPAIYKRFGAKEYGDYQVIPINRIPAGKPQGKAEGGKYITRKIKDGLKDLSKRETLGKGGLTWVMDDPGSILTEWAIGKETVTKTIPNGHEVYYKGTNNRLIYDFKVTETANKQAGRIVAYNTKRIGPSKPFAEDIITKEYPNRVPDAGLLYRIIDGKPTIVDVMVRDDMQKRGLGKALLKAFGDEFGEVRVIGPISKQGRKLVEKFPESTEVIPSPNPTRPPGDGGPDVSLAIGGNPPGRMTPQQLRARYFGTPQQTPAVTRQNAPVTTGQPPARPPEIRPVQDIDIEQQTGKSKVAFDPKTIDLSVEGIKNAAAKAYTTFFMSEYPVKRLASQAGPDVEKEIEEQIRRVRGSGGITEAILTATSKTPFLELAKDGVSEYSHLGNTSLQKILQPIRTKELYQDYERLREAERDLAFWKYRQDDIQAGKLKGIDEQNSRQVVTLLEQKYGPDGFRRLQEISRAHTQFEQQAVLKTLLKAGWMSQEKYDAIMDRPESEFYASYLREMEDVDKQTVGSGGDPVKRIYGSEKRKLPSTEGTIGNVLRTVRLVEKLRLNKQVVALKGLTPELDAMIVERKPRFQSTEITFPRRDAQNHFIKDAQGNRVYQTKKVSVPVGAPANTITVADAGQKKYYELPPDVMKVLENYSGKDINHLYKLMSYPTRLLRAGATLSAEFIARNPIRDQFSAFIYSKYGYNPFTDFARGIFHAIKKDDLYQEFKAAGGENSFFVSLDRQAVNLKAKDLTGRSGKMFKYVRNPVEALRVLSEYSEKGTRVGLYGKARKQGATTQEAATEAREETLDFGRVGTEKSLNQIIAFWNASLQGTDKMFREMRNGKAVLKSVLGITLPSIALWLINNSDDERRRRYKEIPEWRKNFFWNIITSPDMPIISIPKPFELGLIFGSLFERILDWWYLNDKEAMKDIAIAVGEGILPSVIPTAILPFIEHLTGYSFFRGQSLEPKSLEGLPQKLHYTSGTTNAAKMAGKVIDVSPIKLENWMRDWTGSLGYSALAGFDQAFLRGDTPPVGKHWYEITPGVKGFIAREPEGSGSKSVERFYENAKKSLEADAGYKFLAKHQEMDEAKKYVKDERKLIAMADASRKQMSQMALIRRQINHIIDNRETPSDEKRRRIDKLNQMITAQAEKFNTRFDQVMSSGK